MLNQKNKYVPDILDCIANLSNDEVFTSPKLANEMLDMLPQELFSNPNTKFLDPCCKSGVFLREITKRLDKGLEELIPDKQKRIDHILHNQVFGIAITELTAQLSRRTLYCSKYACAIKSGNIWISNDNDSEHGIHEEHSYSISEFTKDDENDFCISAIQGNIRFNRAIKHKYEPIMDDKGHIKKNSKTGKILYKVCPYCGANIETNSEYNHAYEMLHMLDDDKFMEVLKEMQFDVIIGNPPYQLADSSASASASPIYNVFIEQAKKLQPRYLSMIIPSRWMIGGKGLNKFREDMLNDKHITQLYDFVNSNDCFSGVEITGGVCYFLRERDTTKPCHIVTNTSNGQSESIRYLKEAELDVFIRQSELLEIKDKVWKDTTQKSIVDIVSVQKPYGFRTDFFTPTIQENINGKKVKVPITVEEKYGLKAANDKEIKDGFEVLGLQNNKRVWKYLDKNYNFIRKDNLEKYKIFIPKAYGCSAIGENGATLVLGTPILAKPKQCCTETFIEIGGWDNQLEAINAFKYLQTKFFRCMVGIYKQTQDASNRIYKLVPIQNFNKNSDIDWSLSIEEIDKLLYKKYNLSEANIQFIENNIAPMDSIETFNMNDIKNN